MQTIKPQDFSERVTDPNRETWTLGTIAPVVAVLEGREVVVETDRRTGHSVQGEIVGYASTGSSNPGARLKVKTSYVDEKGETRFQTTNYLLWEIGVIVDLGRDFRSTKYEALQRYREDRMAAIDKVRAQAEAEGRDYGKWEATGYGFGRFGVTYTPQREGAGERGLWEVTVDREPATV